ncbi:MAG: tRNA pseudouridine(38-40) synthase TruA [Bacteroidales bacterium]|nr:tRNA pseudouridine(38-40) synthase TruA [Bacteroidales bacterium]
MRYKTELCYNGDNYHGWQIQPNANSVQETLEKCFSLILKEKISFVGAGRTDTGVHAEYYVAHFDTSSPISNIDALVNKMNIFLPKDIAIFSITEVSDEFNARFSATSRSYRYLIHTKKDPFLNSISWFVPYKIDVEKMNQACEIMKQYNDFACFCKSGADNKTTLCNITFAHFTQKGHQIIFEISANRFLRNMVRAITGTMIDIGTGKINLTDFENILKSKNRSEAGQSVPAKALALTKIDY